VNLDLPPYFTYLGQDIRPIGLNLVGLRRAGIQREAVSALKKVYTLLYRSQLKLENALQRIEEEVATPEALHVVRFVRSSQRGIARE